MLASPLPVPLIQNPAAGLDAEELLVGLTAIAVLGIGAQWVAWRVRLPSILLLLLFGIAAGPVAGLLEPGAFLGGLLFPLVSLSVAVILFEGGLTLDLQELRSIGVTLLALVTVGVAVTWGLAAGAAHWIAGMGWPIALLFGAILTVTGPTVIGPILRHVRPKGAVGPIAKWEGVVADVIGASLAVLVFHAVADGARIGEGAFGATVVGLVKTGFAGGLIGLAGAVLLSVPLRRHWIPDHLQSPVTLAVVLGVFTWADHVQSESGLLSVTLMGVVLVNQKRTPIKHIIEFKENLRVLLISSLFIVLAATIELDDLLATGWRDIAFVVVLIVVVRPVSVVLSCVGSPLATREKVFLACLAPRGIVAAAVSALFATELGALGVEGADRLGSLAFLVIIGTVAVYGLSAAPLARRLGLSDPDPQGVLIVGGSRFALAVAKALGQAGLAVQLVDTNREGVATARLAGLAAHYGSGLDEAAEEKIDFGGVGRLLALTPNDEVNSLAALHYTEVFGRAGVYQLVPGAQAKSFGTTSHHLRGRELFSDDASFFALERRVAAGATVKGTPLTAEFDHDAFRERYGERALPLFRLEKDGRLRVFTADAEPDVDGETTLFCLVDPEPEAEGATEA